MDLARAIGKARPGEEWVLGGNTLDALEWLSATEPPTLPECEAAWAVLLQEETAEAAAKEATRLSARAKLHAQGFTDAEIDVMYPTLVAPSAI
jgi:hypothetical protein